MILSLSVYFFFIFLISSSIHSLVSPLPISSYFSIYTSFFSSSPSTSSTCPPLVAPTSFPSFSHYVSPSVPPSSPLLPSSVVDLPIPSVDTYLLASSRTHNIHPMVTRSKAGIYKPKLLLSVSIVMRTSIDTL